MTSPTLYIEPQDDNTITLSCSCDNDISITVSEADELTLGVEALYKVEASAS